MTDSSNDFELANITSGYSSNTLGVIKGAVGIAQLELRVRMVQFLGILIVYIFLFLAVDVQYLLLLDVQHH